jgi:3-hydroxyacyl-[acyl-carrier-protein] dehydratase
VSETVLPHRYPFLFVGPPIEIVPGERIASLVRISEQSRYVLRPHRGPAIFPPALVTEAMAQVGAALALDPPANRGRTIFFRGIERARFYRAVPPGATLRVEARIERLRGRMGSILVRALLDGELAARGRMVFALSD